MERSAAATDASSGPAASAAAVWEEDVVIPTYPVGEPDPNPMFLENRVYQGSSGAVYPLPVIDTLSDEKVDRTYHAVFLENEHVKVMVLPELGGRVHMAYAKKLDYHFVYYNRVIKPALVGLAGPWIAGGIELNWPQHHRPSTFLPVDHAVERGPDGRATVWLGEIDRMQRTKALAGLSLYPGRSYLEISVRLWNRTPFPQTFLWWANPAVHVNDDYQSVFPPDVSAVFDHGRREVSRFPIATGTYYKVDYSAGVDISWYRNIPVPTSYMAYHSEYDFVGGYDHGRKAGILHVADHHVSPGKKQWTWGRGDFGKAWERNLTDEDGPYIELMTGVFTDNQPDFSWLEPGEEKHFTQYFFPYSEIGLVRKATHHAALTLDVKDRAANVGVCVTATRSLRIRVTIEGAGEDVLDVRARVEPEHPFLKTVTVPEGTPPEAVTLSVASDDGEVRISYRPGEHPGRPVPEPATAPLPPSQVQSSDELFHIGLHLEQYRHATFRPEDYYEEALRRDPGDLRCNQAMGLLSLRRGDFARAEAYLRSAVERATSRNPNPSDGAPFLFLGLSLEMQNRDAEAVDTYHKAAWNAGTHAAAHAALARLSLRIGDCRGAAEHAAESLLSNPRNPAVRAIRAMALRKLGERGEALAETAAALDQDPLNWTALNEQALLSADRETANGQDPITIIAGDEVRCRLETAFDYISCGLFVEARDVLKAAPARSAEEKAPDDPLVCYLLGLCCERLSDHESAASWIRRADSLPQGELFVNQLEAIEALDLAGRLFPKGARSSFHLGNLFYANRLFTRAVAAWERAEAADGNFPTVRRNIALASYNKLGDPARARDELEKAFSLDPSDGRVLFELDQLRKRLGVDPAERLRLLEDHLSVVMRRDDLTVEWTGLLNLLGRHAEALDILLSRKLHPWEGGEGRAARQYVSALIGLSKRALEEGRPDEAAALARRALTYPRNIGEGKLAGTLDSDVYYYLGCALESQREAPEARDAFQRASAGEKEPGLSMFYNDQPADLVFFQGLALARLGIEDRARAKFDSLIAYGEQHAHDHVTVDYFAVSLPDMLLFTDDLEKRNSRFCSYLRALGAVGRKDLPRARALFGEVLDGDPSHAGAREMLRDLDRGWWI